MNNDEAAYIRKHLHNVRNPLNSIALHAELGNMLLEGSPSTEELKSAFSNILQQCKECDRVLAELRKIALNDNP